MGLKPWCGYNYGQLHSYEQIILSVDFQITITYTCIYEILVQIYHQSCLIDHIIVEIYISLLII